MTFFATVSVPARLEAHIGGQLSRGAPISSRAVPDVERVYFLVPLCLLHGTGLFNDPTTEIAYFPTAAQAMAWAATDIKRRRRLRRVHAAVAATIRRREEGRP